MHNETSWDLSIWPSSTNIANEKAYRLECKASLWKLGWRRKKKGNGLGIIFFLLFSVLTDLLWMLEMHIAKGWALSSSSPSLYIKLTGLYLFDKKLKIQEKHFLRKGRQEVRNIGERWENEESTAGKALILASSQTEKTIRGVCFHPLFVMHAHTPLRS